MPRIAKVEIADFLRASRERAEEGARTANADGSKLLTSEEAKALPKELQDNFARSIASRPSGRMAASRFVDEFTEGLAAAAAAADSNGDGRLSQREASKLSPEYRDDFRIYARSISTPPAQLLPADATPEGRAQEHADAYGPSPIGYGDAFARAVEAAVLCDGPGSLRRLIRNCGGPDGAPVEDEAEVEATLRRMLAAGRLELLPVGEAGESGAEPARQWIFALDVDAPGDFGFWACVDRESGAASSVGFN